VLAAIRRGLGRDALDASVAAGLVTRLERPEPNRLPAASRGDRVTLLRRFAAKLRRVDATLQVLPRLDGVPEAVAAWAEDAKAVRVAPHPDLQRLHWSAAGLEASFGPARGVDTLGVSRADAGIAESGTLALCSGPASPTTLNFLPDRHVGGVSCRARSTGSPAHPARPTSSRRSTSASTVHASCTCCLSAAGSRGWKRAESGLRRRRRRRRPAVGLRDRDR
jgi:hypothetical protein